MPQERPKKASAFTLIEVLVVVAIVALLVAILLPSLSRARQQAKAVGCLSNLRQIGYSMSLYAVDSKDYLPPFRFPLKYGGAAADPAHDDPYWFQYLPYKYLHNQYEVAACPSDDLATARRIGRGDYGLLTRGPNKIVYSYAMNDEMPTAKNPPYFNLYTAMSAAGRPLVDYLVRYTPTFLGRIKRPSLTDYLNETAQHNLLAGSSTLSQYRIDHGGPKNSRGQRDRMNLLFTDTHGESLLFKNIWYGDFPTGLNLAEDKWPGRFRQLWFGDPVVTTQILY